MTLAFPDSVLAYYKDPQVRAGVDAMMTRSDKLPADLNWHEVPGYYRALAAAQRLVVDHALLLHEIWQVVWEPVIPSDWVKLEPDDQVAETDESPHPKTVWENGAYLRCYSRGLRTIHTGISLSEGGLYLGFGVFKQRTGNSALRQPIEGFDLDEDTECFWQDKPLSIPAGGTFVVDQLVAHLETALLSITNTK
jgi:hypothetical protein